MVKLVDKRRGDIMWKRWVIELGWGADLHGQDVMKALEKLWKTRYPEVV